MKNLLRTLAWKEQVSVTLADTTKMVNEGIRRHGLHTTAAKTFGRALSAMTFMSACLTGETGEISLSTKGNGEGGEIAVSGNQKLYLRGYISNVYAEGMETDCFGREGALTIIRDDGYSRPFVGSCGFTGSGDIDEAFEEYFRISEQLPTRIGTIVEMGEDGVCLFAAVIALQPLPFAEPQTLTEVADMPLTDLLNSIKTYGIEETAKAYFSMDGVWELREAKYQCNCSRKYIGGVLASLGEAQMRQIIQEDGAVRVHCHYCNTDYEFGDEDADRLFKKV